MGNILVAKATRQHRLDQPMAGLVQPSNGVARPNRGADKPQGVESLLVRAAQISDRFRGSPDSLQ